ncbi:MAG: beta-ketoacyl synthase chain length factor [Treponema sp.]|nr:beta-ketoacyl synthase chain length factor [Treponema sp.]
MKEIYISGITKWAPGLSDDEKLWQDWLDGNAQIEQIKESPKLEYTDPLFRRRLSQITKMTVHVVHSLLEKSRVSKETKLVFVSLRGEIEREFTINKGIIEDGMILPAGFSLSVFNTPVSSATLAFGLKGGYSVLYPSQNDFSQAFKAAVAPVIAGTEKEIILVYADELVPEVYGDKRPEENIPLAFACLISADKKDNCISFDDFSNVGKSPVEFLRFLLK